MASSHSVNAADARRRIPASEVSANELVARVLARIPRPVSADVLLERLVDRLAPVLVRAVVAAVKELPTPEVHLTLEQPAREYAIELEDGVPKRLVAQKVMPGAGSQ